MIDPKNDANLAASPNPADERRAQLAALIPEAFSEGKLDLSALKRALGERVVIDGGERYAAHATQASGILFQKSVHTWQRSDLVKAAQLPGSIDDLPPEYKNIVLNSDPNWKRERPIAVINAKDVAKPTDLDDASATCWIKMTKPTFDAFKVAFLDPESRTRLNSQKPEVTAGEIVSMTISGGYLDGVEIAFSRHLNTVIGGRGTGKSTLLECLRYVLDIPPKGKQAQKLHLEIIKENLGKASGRIEMEVVSSSQHGKRYRVSRRYGEMPSLHNPLLRQGVHSGMWRLDCGVSNIRRWRTAEYSSVVRSNFGTQLFENFE